MSTGVWALCLAANANAGTSTQSPTAASAPAAASASLAHPVQPKLDIEAYDVDGNTLLDQVTVEGAVYPYLGPERSRDDVFAARDALQRAYQARGFQSVIVEIPPQDARSGIVRLHVVEAPVGRLRVVDSQYSSLNRIKEQVPSLQEGKVPNFNEAQKEIAEANRLPERRVTPLVKPGKVPGTIDVDLKVSDTLPYHQTIEVNNDHSENTTPLRTDVSFAYSNLWQLGHTITARMLIAPEDPSEVQVYTGSYLAPIWGTPWSVSAYGYTSNSNVATLGGTNVLGKGFTVGMRASRVLESWHDIGQALTFGIDFKHLLQNVQIGTAPPITVDYVPVVASYTTQVATDTVTGTGGLSLTAGLRSPGSSSTAAFQENRAFAHGNFVHLNLDAEATGEIWGGGQLYGRVSAQVADQPLLTGEQFAVGGLTSVRGYLQSEALGDNGLLGSYEFRSPSLAPLVNKATGYGIFDEWRFFAFTDAAMTWVLDALPGQQSAFVLGSVGIGTRLHVLQHFSANIDVAFPMRDGPVTKARKPYLNFSVRSEL